MNLQSEISRKTREKVQVASLRGNDTIEELEKAIVEAKRLGATEYHIHIGVAQGIGPHVQMFEFIKVLSEKEVLENKRNEIKGLLDEIDNKIKVLKAK